MTNDFKFSFPVRMYERERPLPQKLIKCSTSSSPKFGGENQSPVKRPTTLYDLIQEFVPNKNGKGDEKINSLNIDRLKWFLMLIKYV